MSYLLFTLFFVGYLLVGTFTNLVELSSFATVISVALICTNLYLFIKSRKNTNKEET
ncbi:hypothetical protein [Halobacillus alkaliphilus]|uniref:hypothetical protein n=1 Tax=Halobacillus alkaliphilus TaxID=396056 RepID=UPI000A5029D7|nr:hypothetical protein [Halobacillus alkaliphilus]